MFLKLVTLFILSCFAKDSGKDTSIIACHSSDYYCLKQQYKSIRDHVLVGNQKLGIPPLEPYLFDYGDDTCVKITGLEHSNIMAITMNSTSNEFSMTLEAPFKVEQVKQHKLRCKKPKHMFHIKTRLAGELYKFKGNATINVKFPYKIQWNKGKPHMLLLQEELDVILDIADLSGYDKKDIFQERLYIASEWAFDAIQHLDAAEEIVLPFMNRLRTFTSQVPLEEYLMLYPDEEYGNLTFSYSEEDINFQTCFMYLGKKW